MTTDCAYCKADGGMYDYGKDCCLVRFIVKVPLKEMRAAYLEQWAIRYGSERIEQVKLLIAEAWEVKRKEALGRVKA